MTTFNEFIDSQEFYELCYSYRCTPMEKQDLVVERFEALKKELKSRNQTAVIETKAESLKPISRHYFKKTSYSDWRDKKVTTRFYNENIGGDKIPAGTLVTVISKSDRGLNIRTNEGIEIHNVSYEYLSVEQIN